MGMQVADLFASLGLKVDKGSFDKGSEVINGLKKGIAAFVGFEAIKSIGEAVMATVELGGHLDDLRQKTGLTAEALQEYGYIAKLGGSSMDAFAGGVTKFARVLAEASGGSQEAAKSLHAVGLTATQIAAALKGGAGLDGALGTIADKFAKMPDGPQKTAAAMQLFGKSGAELIPTLNKGAAGLAELRKEARDLGVVMGEDAVSAADELGDNIDKVKMSITGLKNQAVSALLPMIKELVDGLLGWVKANRELIIGTVTKLVNGLVIAVKVLSEVIGTTVDVFRYLYDLLDKSEHGFTALGIVITAVILPALGAMALGWIAALAPVIAFAAAVAAAAIVINDVIKAILDGKGVTAEVCRFIADKFRALGRGIVDAFKAIGGFFTGIASTIKDSFVAVFDWIAEKISWAISAVGKVAHYATHPWELAAAAGHYFSGGDGADATDSVVQAPERSMPAGAAAAPQVTVNAPATVTITGNIPPDWIDTKVDRKIADHHDQVMRNADPGDEGDQ